VLLEVLASLVERLAALLEVLVASLVLPLLVASLIVVLEVVAFVVEVWLTTLLEVRLSSVGLSLESSLLLVLLRLSL